MTIAARPAAQIQQGMQVRIPCSTRNGAFKDEYLVTIKTADKEIEGFINSDIVFDDEQGRKYVVGVVREVREDVVVIHLPGSFFTTAGLINLPIRMLEPTHDPIAS